MLIYFAKAAQAAKKKMENSSSYFIFVAESIKIEHKQIQSIRNVNSNLFNKYEKRYK